MRPHEEIRQLRARVDSLQRQAVRDLEAIKDLVAQRDTEIQRGERAMKALDGLIGAQVLVLDGVRAQCEDIEKEHYGRRTSKYRGEAGTPPRQEER